MDSTNRETEAKFLVHDLRKVQARLHEFGARLIQPRTHEINLRFDTKDLSLHKAGQILRLRRDQQPRLTLKGDAREIEGAISRMEIEFTVGDFERARQFIEALGYREIFRYEKYRTTYQLEQTTVVLDELPFGAFVEIEGVLDALQPLSNRLNLKWDRSILAGYHDLFERVRERRGLELRDLTFENFRDLTISPADLASQFADSE